MGQQIELVASDGHRLAAYRAAGGLTPRGGIVVVQEIFGVNAHIRQVADGFAQDGYLAIAPALFDRVEGGVELGYDAKDIARGRELKGRSPLEPALEDVAAAVAAASVAGSVGVVGYCWGGLLSFLAAARVPGLSCAVAYYGGGVLDHAGDRARCPVLFHFGERDAMIPIEGVRGFAAAHPEHTVHLYPADHGFNCDHRGSYDAASARLARERTIAFFGEHLG